MTKLNADVLTEQRVLCSYRAGWGFDLAMALATIIFGFVYCPRLSSRSAGVYLARGTRKHCLKSCAPQSREKRSKSRVSLASASRKWNMSRYSFFLVASMASFCWYWFPDFIFPALSYFIFVCWVPPDNVVVNQVFGMSSGIGLPSLTFDCK